MSAQCRPCELVCDARLGLVEAMLSEVRTPIPHEVTSARFEKPLPLGVWRRAPPIRFRSPQTPSCPCSRFREREGYRKRYFTLDGDTVSDRMLSFPRVFLWDVPSNLSPPRQAKSLDAVRLDKLEGSAASE